MREFALLQHIFASNASLPDGVTIPPGDDMGALCIGGQTVLVTVDQIADGVHVDVSNTALEKIGRKAITRNLSDVAAMAARPVGAVAAASLPRDFGEAQAQALFEAMRVTAASFECPLFGGDVSMWDQAMVLSVTVLAEPFEGVEPVLRSGARPGDAVFVTGTLGGSLVTMNVSRDGDGDADRERDQELAKVLGQRSGFAGYTQHLDFSPRLETARRLASNAATRPTAMIDLSDGLLGDVKHICEQSRVDAVLELERLPVSQAAKLASKRSGKPAWVHALTDGEDYELLFTADRDAVPERVHDVPVTCIGYVRECSGEQPAVTVRDAQGNNVGDIGAHSWEHHG